MICFEKVRCDPMRVGTGIVGEARARATGKPLCGKQLRSVRKGLPGEAPELIWIVLANIVSVCLAPHRWRGQRDCQTQRRSRAKHLMEEGTPGLSSPEEVGGLAASSLDSRRAIGLFNGN